MSLMVLVECVRFASIYFIIKSNNYNSITASQGMYALHMESTTIYRLVEETFFEHEKCGLTGIDFLYMIDPWVVIQKRLPYKEMIKVKYVYIVYGSKIMLQF